MRKKLLGGLSNDKQGKKRGSRTQMADVGMQLESDDQMSDGCKEELQVNFGVGFGEDIGKKLI